MSDREVKTIAVIGAGIMGHGIAQVAAMSGFHVCLYDQAGEVLEKAKKQIQQNLHKGLQKGKIMQADCDRTLTNLETCSDLWQAVEHAELVIEAIPENLALKIELFGKLSRKVGDQVILASNTSSLSIAKIAAAATKPERILGMHFFNPPYLLKLLELVYGPRTGKDFLATAQEVARRMNREVIVVRDSPGFATSRLGVVLGLEAMRMVEEGVAAPEDIDRAMVLGYGHPIGPLKLTDLVGLDTRLAIAEYLYKEKGSEQYRPPALLREKVSEKKLGKKSGEGFYRWEREDEGT